MSSLAKIREIFPRSTKIKLLIILLGIIVGAQIETLTVSVIQPFIFVLTDPDIVESDGIIGSAFAFFGFGDRVAFLAFLALVIAGVYAFRGLYVYFFTRIQNRFTANNTAMLTNRLLAETLARPYLYHVSLNPLSIQRKMVRDSERLFGLLNAVSALLADALMSLFILVFLLFTSFSMTMIVLFLASICIAVYFKIFKKRVASSSEEELRGQVMVNKSLLQALSGIKEIKIMGRESFFTKKFKTVNENTIKTRIQVRTIMQLPKLFIESLCFSGAFIVIAAAIFFGIDMDMLVPQLGIFLIAAFKLLPAISRTVNSVTGIIRMYPSIGQVHSGLFDRGDEHSALLPAASPQTATKDVVISELTFKYPGARRPVLAGMSFAIPHNSSCGLIGLSGVGKSTLVDVILGILAPQQGYVYYNGKSVHHNFAEWTKIVGYVPQNIYLLDETIADNVAFGVEKNKIDEAKIWEALKHAQLDEFVRDLPDGLRTEVGERGVRLSGGQRQRIGIARALYSDPSILVLDEATSSLDIATERAVMDAIMEMRGKRTLIIVAHRLSTVERCDIVYEVRKARVIQKR